MHCNRCYRKKHRNGKISYYHHMLGAAIVYPEHKVVIPLAPEPIVKGDGNTKNDCERNAAKRLLSDFRREHPHLKTLIVEDGLGSNFPHLSLLDSLNIAYIIGAKPGDHAFIFEWIGNLTPQIHTHQEPGGTLHEYHYYHDVPLNDSNFDYRVNVLSYTETNKTCQHIGAFKVLFERVRALIHLGVFVDWETLFIYIANPAQRAPLTQDWTFQLKK